MVTLREVEDRLTKVEIKITYLLDTIEKLRGG